MVDAKKTGDLKLYQQQVFDEGFRTTALFLEYLGGQI